MTGHMLIEIYQTGMGAKTINYEECKQLKSISVRAEFLKYTNTKAKEIMVLLYNLGRVIDTY